jgi:GntR family transcriptional regulator
MSSIDPTDPRPPYRQIADQLRAAIYAGELGPGSRLPSERELVERYGTAHQTVRQAVNLLKTEGLVIGQAGRGVFVRERPPVLHRLDATRRFLSQARAQGRAAEARLLDVQFVPPPIEVAGNLNLDPARQVLCRRYLLLVDGEPAQLAATYFPAEIAEGSIIAGPEDVSPGRIDADLKNRLGIEPVRFGDELTARMPTVEEARALRLLPGTPVIDLSRTYYDATNRPFEAVRFTLAGDKHVLAYEGRPGWLEASDNGRSDN